MFVDEFNLGNGVFHQILCLQRIIVVLSIISIVFLHTVKETLTACFQQFLRLCLQNSTEQFIKTFIFYSISLDFT